MGTKPGAHENDHALYVSSECNDHDPLNLSSSWRPAGPKALANADACTKTLLVWVKDQRILKATFNTKQSTEAPFCRTVRLKSTRGENSSCPNGLGQPLSEPVVVRQELHCGEMPWHPCQCQTLEFIEQSGQQAMKSLGAARFCPSEPAAAASPHKSGCNG